MIAAGILDETERLELLNGELILMSPIGPKHSSIVKRINQLLQNLLNDRNTIVSIQDPITLEPASEPEPDIALLKNRPDFYANSHPTASDIYLIIEVADTTLEKDRQLKGNIYAKSGIPQYWIINLVDQQIEVYDTPIGEKYAHQQTYGIGENITLPFFNITIAVGQFFGF
mgnify:CR=1 FL=1